MILYGFSMKRLVKFCIMLITLAVPLSAEFSFADNSLIALNSLPGNPVLKLTRESKAKRIEVALDDEGNVILRRGKVSLTFIYGADEAVDVTKERSGMVPPSREASGIGAITVKLGMLF